MSAFASVASSSCTLPNPLASTSLSNGPVLATMESAGVVVIVAISSGPRSSASQSASSATMANASPHDTGRALSNVSSSSRSSSTAGGAPATSSIVVGPNVERWPTTSTALTVNDRAPSPTLIAQVYVAPDTVHVTVSLSDGHSNTFDVNGQSSSTLLSA